MSTPGTTWQPLDWRGHLEGLRQAVVAFARHAESAGMRAPVPTTPDWTVRRLVAHQGTVHRWAAAQLSGTGGPVDGVDDDADVDRWEQEGMDAPDPLEWLRDGAVEVAGVIAAAGDDAVAPVFLAGTGRPRDFWARRQCHETTIHAVDALAACLGRLPTAAETWIDPALAVDGIDELITGFLPRPRTRLRSEEPLALGVQVEDGPGWLVEVGPEHPVTTRVDAADPRLEEADVVLRGSAVALYLTLWNRSDEVAPEDRAGHWARWESTAVVWG